MPPPTVRFITASSILVAALASVVAALPWLPAPRPVAPDARIFALRARMTSTKPGNVQLYWNSGHGYREPDSSVQPVASGDEPRTYLLPLPMGTYPELRFDPIDNDARIQLWDLSIVDAQGRVSRDIPWSDVEALNQIRSIETGDGRLAVEVVPGGTDPQLRVKFSEALVVRMPSEPAAKVLAALVRLSLATFAVILGSLAALQYSARLRGLAAGVPARLVLRPGRAILGVAALATAASSYPVLFLGDSFVSPEMAGMTLLYDTHPTLPGKGDGRVTAPEGSDIGAILWQHIPLAQVERGSLGRGEVPYWNRYNNCGVPLLGQGQAMVGDPLNFLVMLAGGNSWAWDLKYLAAKALFAACLGLIVFHLTGRLSAASVVTLAAPFAGFFVYRINHPAFFSFCYAPWVLYCWIRLGRQAGRSGIFPWTAALVAANAALLCSGTVKEAYMLIVTMNLSGLAVLCAAEPDARRRGGKLLCAGAGAVVLVLITAPVWRVFLDALRHAYTGYNLPSAYQLQPSLLLGLFDEVLYRPLTFGTRVFDPSANFLILAGALYFLATLRSHFRSSAVIALAASSLVPLAFAFGLVPPAWIERIPFLANVAHIDNSFSCGLIILWTILAGVGFAAAFDRLGRPEGRADLAIVFLLLAWLVFQYVAFGHAIHKPVESGDTLSVIHAGESLPVSSFIWGYLASLILALAGLSLLARHVLASGRITASAALGVALCVAVLLWRQGLQPASAHFDDYTVHPGTRADFQGRSGAVEFVRAADRTEPSRSIGFRGNLMPGWNDEYGIEEICGPEALSSPDFRDLIGASPLERIWDWRIYLHPADVASCRRILDFLNVRYYFDIPGDEPAAKASLHPAYSGDLEVTQSPTAWPRAFFTDRVAGYKATSDLVGMVAGGDGRPFAAVPAPEIGASPDYSRMDAGLVGRTVVPASAYTLTENSTSFSVHAPGPGIVVLTEVFWPGYPHAELNGEPVPINRVNAAFQGVLVPSAGDYRLVVRYRPGCATASLWLAAVGWGAIVLGGACNLRRSGRDKVA